jgi:hypothetical protein
MSQIGSQFTPKTKPGSNDKITVLNPACSSTMAEKASLTPRTFSSLVEKTVFLVDIGWGGPKAGLDVLDVMRGWFTRNIPSVKTVLVSKKGGFGDDDPELWKRIRAEGDVCIIGISC